MLRIIVTDDCGQKAFDGLAKRSVCKELLEMACDTLGVNPEKEPALYHAACEQVTGFGGGIEIRLEGLEDKPGREIKPALDQLCARVKAITDGLAPNGTLIQIRGTATPSSCVETEALYTTTKE